MRFAIVLVLLLSVTTPADGQVRRRGVNPPELQGTEAILWIGAHPDDEILAAPLLARACGVGRARCTFLILTRGENGVCLLPGGCHPDLRTVRSAEAAYASSLLSADLILLNLPDGGGAHAHPDSWSAPSPGRDALVRRIARLVDAVSPRSIVTFDPRHGTTCHADHRATGRLVLDAMAKAEQRPDLYLLETLVDLSDGPFRLEFRMPAPLAAIVEEVDGSLPAGRDDATTGWDWMIRMMRVHASQFDDEWIAAVRDVPPLQRRTWFARAERAMDIPLLECGDANAP